MNWRDILVSRHTLFLEREIADLKKRHETELSRALSEIQRLQQEVNGLRLSRGEPGLLPETEDVRQPVDPDAPPVFQGTPFERITQREMWMESPAGKRWMAKLLNDAKIGGAEKEKQNAASN
jgi:hypothetical protein